MIEGTEYVISPQNNCIYIYYVLFQNSTKWVSAKWDLAKRVLAKREDTLTCSLLMPILSPVVTRCSTMPYILQPHSF